MAGPAGGRGPEIRRAGPDDVEAVADLVLAFRRFLEAAGPGRDTVRARVREAIADPAVVFLLAREGPGAPAIGYAQYRVFASVWTEGREAYVEDVFVEAASRGTGAGAALLRAACEGARAAGATAIALTTNERNRDALGFYAAHGFVPASEPRWGEGREIRLERALDDEG